MIANIDNVRTAGPGRLAFDVLTDVDGADECINLTLGDQQISIHARAGPNSMSEYVIEHGQRGIHLVTLSAELSGTHSTPVSLNFSEPAPKDIIFCQKCQEWHKRGKPC
jgi:hypothetical protein